MKRHMMMASAALLALAACGDEAGQGTDTMSGGNIAMDNLTMDGNAISDPIPANGQQYAAMAAASDLYEIESARLAQEKSQNAEIRELARMIVTDHEKSTADLRNAAQQAQPAITVTPRMDAEQQQMMQALQNAGVEDFDSTYLQQQVMAHEKALAMVQGYGQSGDVPALQQHAQAVAGPIQRHLERARALMQQGAQ